MVAGDFNVVAEQNEKLGGCPLNLNDVADFLEMIQQASLSDIGYNGSKFTWTNNRLCGAAIAERLARASLNCEWISGLSTRMDHLNRACSDHTPLLISV